MPIIVGGSCSLPLPLPTSGEAPFHPSVAPLLPNMGSYPLLHQTKNISSLL